MQLRYGSRKKFDLNKQLFSSNILTWKENEEKARKRRQKIKEEEKNVRKKI